MIETEKLSCPSCNATINPVTPSATYAKCEYCGTKVSIVVKQEKLSEISGVPQKKLRIQYDCEDFAKEILLDYFVVEEYIPDDIYDEVQFCLIDLYVLPYYYYCGSYTTYWNCEVGTDYQRQRVVQGTDGKTEVQNYTETVWSPQSGVASGQFSYMGFASGPTEKWHEIIPYCVESSSFTLVSVNEPEAVEVEQDILSIECRINLEDTWDHRRVKSAVENDANNAGQEQIDQYSQTRNENITSSIQLNDKLICYVHTPFWVAKISYKNKEYYLGMFGCGSEIFGNPPCDKDRMAVVKEYENKQEMCKAAIVGPLILAVSLFVVEIVWNLFWSGLFNIQCLEFEFLSKCGGFLLQLTVYFLLPVCVVVYLYCMYKINQILKESQNNRRQARDAVAARGIEKYIHNVPSSTLSE